MTLLNKDFSKSKMFMFWFCIWTGLGLLQMFRLYYAYNVYDTIVSWQRAAMWAFSEWYIWGILAIYIYKYINWLEINHKSLSLKISSFLIGLVTIPPLHLYIYSVFWFMTRNIYPANVGSSYNSATDIFVGSYLGKVNDNSVAYFLIVAAIFAFTYYKRLYLEQKRVAEINQQLVEAKLQQLKTQLHPHFLFNTLNSITSLIHTDPERADLMTTKLSDLLRISIDADSAQQVPLETEIKFLEKYLDIQKIRFENRMEVKMHIAPETKQIAIPYLILQPIVENAIKHGVSKFSEKVTIELHSKIENQHLIISISNDKSSLPSDIEEIVKKQTGLQNTRERLVQIYKDKASLKIDAVEPSGVEVKLTIPLTE